MRILRGDVLAMLATLPDESVHCCVTSPPYYGLRDYGVAGQLGLEPTLAEYIEKMVAVFGEVRRVLRSDGTLWLNIGDSYARAPEKGGSGTPNGRNDSAAGYGFAQSAKIGSSDGFVARGNRPGTRASDAKPKDLLMVPERLALALQADGWWVRSRIIWHKLSAMPESVTDRPTKAHEHLWLLSKSERYFYDTEAAKEPVTQDERDRKAVPNVKRSGNKERKDQTAHAGRGVQSNLAALSNHHQEYATRNWRDVWSLGPEPFKDAHFATFPTEIPRRAIVAGTSEKGCCVACGAPWARESEVVGRQVTDAMRYAGGDDAGDYRGEAVKAYEGTGAQNASDVKRRVLESMGKVRAYSWRPSCDCDEGDPVPAIVLDPFLGSGTTALVADRLQRNAIGIELNPAYADMAEKRIRGDAPLLAEVAA